MSMYNLYANCIFFFFFFFVLTLKWILLINMIIFLGYVRFLKNSIIEIEFTENKDISWCITLSCLFTIITLKTRGCPRCVMVKAMNCGIVVREFVLQSRYYVHFRANTLGKGIEPPYPPSYASRRIALALNNLQRLICH